MEITLLHFLVTFCRRQTASVNVARVLIRNKVLLIIHTLRSTLILLYIKTLCLKNYSSFYDSNPEATVTETARHIKADIEIDEEDDLDEDAMVPTRPEIHTSRALHCPN